MAKQRQPRTPAAPTAGAPQRPALQEVSQFMVLEREVEIQYRPLMREALQSKVTAVADSVRSQTPVCSRCSEPMKRHDTETVSWVARFGDLQSPVDRYRCPRCKDESRPLLDLLGVEPGRISGSLARLLALLAVVAPYALAAELAWLLLGVKVSDMGVWKVVQRLGESAARYSQGLSQYHADSRSEGASTREAPPAVVLSVDGSMLGMQVRKQRRRRTGAEPLPPLPPVNEGGPIPGGQNRGAAVAQHAAIHTQHHGWRSLPCGGTFPATVGMVSAHPFAITDGRLEIGRAHV